MTGNCRTTGKWQDDREYGRRKKDCGQETRRNGKGKEIVSNKREDRKGKKAGKSKKKKVEKIND